jgi:hypothetical protein
MHIKKATLLFSALLLGYFLLIKYPKLLFSRPQSIHQWAQCDRASVALNYYQNGYDFFHPQTHNISNGTGVTGLEFPLIQFTAAALYGIFGFHEFFYRLIIFLAFFTGIINLYRLTRIYIHNPVLAVLPPLLMAASPVLAYYGISFLPEAASLGLSLSAWYYFMRDRNENTNSLWKIIFLCLCASFIKITSLINPAAMSLLLLTANGTASLKQNFKRIIPYLIIPLPVFAWYAYASWLNKKYNSSVFMLELRPVSSWEEFTSVWKEILEIWWWRFYPAKYFIALAAGSIIALLFHKKANKLLLRTTVFLYAGSLVFFLLMYTQFRVHDYYIIPLMPAFFFHWLLLADIYIKLPSRHVVQVSFFLALALITGFTIGDAKDHLRTAHNKESWKYGSKTFDLYFDFEPELRSLNIKRNDGVVSIYDQSYNISLYLMNQNGITVGPKTPQDTIVKIIRNSHLPYAILNNFNPERFDHVMDSLNLGKCIYRKNELSIYQLTPTNKFEN